MELTVREMIEEDIKSAVDYFVNADEFYLKSMGAEKSKFPKREDWINKIKTEIGKPVNEKESYYIIWLKNGAPIGHSNINNIKYGHSARMHLHMWRKDNRAKGLGIKFMRKSISYYFKNFKLETLYCEPYAENPTPHNVLTKMGFSFIRSYETIPGWICFRQMVNRYELHVDKFNALQKTSPRDI
jgi:RimJ/RimL family protein N-acetyltransferase